MLTPGWNSSARRNLAFSGGQDALHFSVPNGLWQTRLSIELPWGHHNRAPTGFAMPLIVEGWERWTKSFQRY